MFTSRPPAAPRRSAGPAGLFALAALAAVLLDGLGLRVPGPLAGVHALELVALAGLGAALVRHGRGRDATGWATPVDGRIVALLLVLVLAAMPGRPVSPGAIELRLVFAGAALFYALGRLASHGPGGVEALWTVFPAAATTLGLHALWAATTGLERLRADARLADAAWQGHGALATATIFATLLTLGRALERGASPAWRLAALVGAVGGGLHAAASGLPFRTGSLGRLEDPLGFSSAVVTILVLHAFGSMAWTLRRERRREVARWWGTMAGTTFLGAGVLFRPGPPGEGLVLLAVACGAMIVATRSQPPAAAAVLPGPPRAELRRAA